LFSSIVNKLEEKQNKLISKKQKLAVEKAHGKILFPSKICDTSASAYFFSMGPSNLVHAFEKI